jgi:2-oxoglutarate dehydrogenase E1 component
LTMLLPHGYEGMGPEHSSARPERFLQMCNEDDEINLKEVELNEQFVAKQLHDTNWIVANCTTPANLFHLLRRQIYLPFRKPLIVMTPKMLLRHPLARSPVEDFLPGQSFQRVIPDAGKVLENPDGVKKIVFCTGKVFVDIFNARNQTKTDDKIAVIRVEQICPFPYDQIKSECDRFPNAEIFWAQEEPKNMGAWTYVQPRLNSLLSSISRNLGVKYVGRKPSASPATGNKYTHEKELTEFLSKITGEQIPTKEKQNKETKPETS